MKSAENTRALSDLEEGQEGSVQNIRGDSRFVSRIVSIGLTPRTSFKVLKNDGRSPLLLFCRDTVIAVNRKECKQIEVCA